MSVPELAARHRLQPHPEGGWYRQTWASPVEVAVPDGEGAVRTRPTATLILFLLTAGESSAWHRVLSDEVWIAQVGGVVVELGGDESEPGEGPRFRLGLDDDDHPQVLVPAGVWQRTLPTDHDVLVSCLVSPGFDFEDFRLA